MDVDTSPTEDFAGWAHHQLAVTVIASIEPNPCIVLQIDNMERSSPLAAMQPPALPFGQFGCRAGLRDSYPDYGGNYGGAMGFGPSSFNFKDLSMTRAPTDYFSLKPVRGSSPTASLAADLSQNFHIDQRYACQSSNCQLGNTDALQSSTGYTTSSPLFIDKFIWEIQWSW